MSEAQRIIRQGQTRWEKADWEAYEDLFGSDGVWLNADGEDTYRGGQEIFAFLKAFREAWGDDCRLEITQEFGDDENWVTIGRFSGTNTGPIPTPAGPLPATGKKVSLPLCQVVTVRDGKVTRLLNCNTVMYLLMQLGMAPAPESVPA